jgi:DNA mismatch endonuclease (patch repair protein)
MSRISGKNTKPEITLRKKLWQMGFRYRLHAKLPGKPDFVFPKYRVAVFVDGCFWHGCPLHAQEPKTNAEFWDKKLLDNKERDRKVNDLLLQNGWIVVRVWEHEIRDSLEEAVRKVVRFLE